MSDGVNIHVLIAKLTSPQVHAYLVRTGWTNVEPQRGDRSHYTGPIHEGGRPYEISIPTAAHWQRSRGRLQTFLFNLSGIEDREPWEIARDILAESPVMPYVQQDEPATHPRRIQVRNEGASAVVISLANPVRGIHLAPGRAIALVLRGNSAGTAEIVLQDGNARLSITEDLTVDVEVL
jgi:hypothetical protein